MSYQVELREFTSEEIESHDNENSCWLIIDGNVYDATKYLEEHPGGEFVLLDNGGQDATEAFENQGHSDDAREILKSFKIGVIKGDKKTLYNKWGPNRHWDSYQNMLPCCLSLSLLFGLGLGLTIWLYYRNSQSVNRALKPIFTRSK